VQAVVFEVNDRNRIGYQTADGVTRRYCCTKAGFAFVFFNDVLRRA
jgi:hypothetical protein